MLAQWHPQKLARMDCNTLDGMSQTCCVQTVAWKQVKDANIHSQRKPSAGISNCGGFLFVHVQTTNHSIRMAEGHAMRSCWRCPQTQGSRKLYNQSTGVGCLYSPESSRWVCEGSWGLLWRECFGIILARRAPMLMLRRFTYKGLLWQLPSGMLSSTF